MTKRLPTWLILIFLILAGCDQEKESLNPDFGKEYQPLGIGNFWIYEVDEIIYYGENDSESDQYFYKDSVRTSYLNAVGEIAFVVERSKSSDRQNWIFELEYTMIHRDKVFLRTVNNRALVALVFPPELGRIWNGNIYQAQGNDDFEIEQVGQTNFPGFEGVSTVRVSQEDLDDLITIRDIRYEVFGRGVGLLEKYDEVLTYCSRNDCLGQQLITSGSKTHLKLLEYGSN